MIDIGCMTSSAINYDPNAIIDDGSCYFTTIQTIISNPIIGDDVITAGIITDYTNLVDYNGPHIIKISENFTGNTIQVKI